MKTKWVVFTLLAVTACGQDRAAVQRLGEALRGRDTDRVREVVRELRAKLGDKAGDPEVADKYAPVPADAKPMTREEALGAWDKTRDKLTALRWWKIGLDPTHTEHALREPAAVISAAAIAARAGLPGREWSLEMAREAAEFLIWTQDQAGAGLFPFPAIRGGQTDNAFASAERYFARAEKEGWLDKIVRNGWAFDDRGDGGLQYDNGDAGVAMFDLYGVTKEKRYLESAMKSARWAAGRECVANWNYNAFSVWLLARAAKVSGDKALGEAATHKALHCVIPGQMTDGPRAGRWLDAHNARPAYHYIMMRALASLADVLPADSAARRTVMDSLTLGLKSRNAEFAAKGIMNTESASVVLAEIALQFAADKRFLEETRTLEALNVFDRFFAAKYRGGDLPVGPRSWAAFLAWKVR